MTDGEDSKDSGLRINIHGLGIEGPAMRVAYKEPAGGRNAACPCGSGKKFKKCHGKPSDVAAGERPRRQKIDLEFAEPITIRADEPGQLFIKMDPFSKGIEVISQGSVVTPHVVGIEQNYARAKGPKVVATARVAGVDAHFDFARALTSYAMCFGVDTNFREIDGETIAVTGVTTFDPSPSPSARLMIFPSIAFEMRGPKSSPEKIGWLRAIQAITGSPKFDSQKRYCIVVDSHLDELPAINRHEQPILGECLLPAHFDLIYASADAGNDTQNRLIRYADWCASEIFKLIEVGFATLELDRTTDDLCEGRRDWDIPNLVEQGVIKLNK